MFKFSFDGRLFPYLADSLTFVSRRFPEQIGEHATAVGMNVGANNSV